MEAYARNDALERQIGHRLKLRDLHVFFCVVDAGSMSKAAEQLGISTPSVSDVIAGLEHALGVRLFDRSSKGVVLTDYGHALLIRARAAFDELRQAIRDIDFIRDPGAGEVHVGCPESVAAGFLLPVVERLAGTHPRLRMHVQQVHTPNVEFPELEQRKVDLVVARLAKAPANGRFDNELKIEVLFPDPFYVVVSKAGRWGRQRGKVSLGDLADERWILPPSDALAGGLVATAYEACGLAAPLPRLETFSIHLRSNLVECGDFVTALPRSVLRFIGCRDALEVLPIELADSGSCVAIVTLQHRTLTPAVQSFIECARVVAASLDE